ncbi:hypothetical protein [Hymenobacter bucti]|uniref:STAS/SEC14 domain-containing protein n=1 Tax=Hymenobacter bucti TaxID=1844114 RepID=A0ABW4QU47_9BACT
MLTYHSSHPDGREYCRAEYNETDHWLHATWKGVVTTPDGQRAAAKMLQQLHLTQVPYLLNDNSQVLGPWFDSVDWLQHIWAPQATRLGLRYVAHVLQPHTEDDLGLLLQHNPFAGKFELQFFTNLADATTWLRDRQRLDAQRSPAPTLPAPSTATA